MPVCLMFSSVPISLLKMKREKIKIILTSECWSVGMVGDPWLESPFFKELATVIAWSLPANQNVTL